MRKVAALPPDQLQGVGVADRGAHWMRGSPERRARRPGRDLARRTGLSREKRRAVVKARGEEQCVAGRGRLPSLYRHPPGGMWTRRAGSPRRPRFSSLRRCRCGSRGANTERRPAARRRGLTDRAVGGRLGLHTQTGRVNNETDTVCGSSFVSLRFRFEPVKIRAECRCRAHDFKPTPDGGGRSWRTATMMSQLPRS
jgi:hypothetical protein